MSAPEKDDATHASEPPGDQAPAGSPGLSRRGLLKGIAALLPMPIAATAAGSDDREVAVARDIIAEYLEATRVALEFWAARSEAASLDGSWDRAEERRATAETNLIRSILRFGRGFGRGSQRRVEALEKHYYPPCGLLHEGWLYIAYPEEFSQYCMAEGQTRSDGANVMRLLVLDMAGVADLD